MNEYSLAKVQSFTYDNGYVIVEKLPQLGDRDTKLFVLSHICHFHDL